MNKPKKGKPFEYTQEKHDKIIASIKRNLPYEAAAWSARICERTLYYWIESGRNDFKEGNDTVFAQLLQDILETEAEKMGEHLDAIEGGHIAWRGRLAILERRWRKFFGADAGIIQELLELITKLKEDIANLKANQGKGIVNG
jgi:hypothetical protein